MALSAKIVIMEAWVIIEFQVTTTSIYAYAEMSPVMIKNSAGEAILQISAARDTPDIGPKFLVDLKAAPPSALIDIKGYIGFPKLDTGAEVALRLNAVRHRLCLVFPLPSWPRHRLRLVFPLPSWLRHRLSLRL